MWDVWNVNACVNVYLYLFLYVYVYVYVFVCVCMHKSWLIIFCIYRNALKTFSSVGAVLSWAHWRATHCGAARDAANGRVPCAQQQIEPRQLHYHVVSFWLEAAYGMWHFLHSVRMYYHVFTFWHTRGVVNFYWHLYVWFNMCWRAANIIPF